ncbi:MAG TPA: phosphate ABC transporter substrate-binding protein PstS [Gemmatimonadaceae bacterium]|nr:phosphate ABC transporter substrate-binding protein PstS [Gemmatimonadaceae bacterium]
MPRARRAAFAICAVAVAACGSGSKSSGANASADTGNATAASSASSSSDLTGAGSTFAAPIYTAWAQKYAQTGGAHVNYQSVGSGAGIKQLSEETVDFGASDGPMTDQQIAGAKGGPVMHFPTVLGGVSITYNLPEVKQPLKFTGPLLADIYLGTINKWNDPRIAAVNPGVTLPAKDIVVTHRTEGSGTTYIFTDYLSTVSPKWGSGPGKAQIINWPVGLGGKGSEGVTGLVKQTPGAIGYIELSYAKQNNLPSALIQNAAGEWVTPTLESVTAAAAGAAAKLPANTDYRISIVNAPGKGAYPISSFTWILVYRNMPNAAKADELKKFLKWSYDTGESSAASLDYAPLPSAMIQRLAARVDSINAGASK